MYISFSVNVKKNMKRKNNIQRSVFHSLEVIGINESANEFVQRISNLIEKRC